MSSESKKLKTVDLRISSKTWMICLISLSFLLHFFINTVSSGFYLISVALSVVLFIIFKPISFKFDFLKILLLVTAGCMVLSYFKSTRLLGTTMDIVVLLAGILIALFPSKKSQDYRSIIYVVVVFSFIYMAGILLQAVLPSVYNLILSVLSDKFRQAINSAASSTNSFYNGFTTNVGFAAGFISTGIIAVFSEAGEFSKIKKSRIIVLMVMFLTLMLTGKRGTTLFLFLSVIICYLIAGKDSFKFKRYFKIILLVLVILLIFLIFYDSLVKIPFMRRIVESIEGLRAGDDITSARSNLWKWAIRLFKENPIFGIGWGDYRTTVIGNVTFERELDAHNIYLQLLCETGIIGTLVIVSMFVFFWIATKNAYKRSLMSNDENFAAWRPVLLFSLLFQTFFLLYGFSGNPLYDQNYQIVYMACLSTTMGYRCVDVVSKKSKLRKGKT